MDGAIMSNRDWLEYEAVPNEPNSDPIHNVTSVIISLEAHFIILAT